MSEGQVKELEVARIMASLQLKASKLNNLLNDKKWEKAETLALELGRDLFTVAHAAAGKR